MIIRFKKRAKKIRDLKYGTVFMWNDKVYMLTTDQDVSAVNLSTGDIEGFSPLAEVEEKEAELILSEIV